MDIKSILKSKKAIRDFIGKCYPITDFIGNSYGLIKCPFHDDNRPSAKIFLDSDYPRLWCYAEGKQYSSYDYISMVLGIDPVEFVKGKITENPESIRILADAFVLTTTKQSAFPIKEILEKDFTECTADSISAVLNKMYLSNKREED